MSRSRRDNVSANIYNPFIMGGGKNLAQGRGSLIEMMYLRMLSELACNRFKWIGLPDTVDERFLELMLFRQALSVFYFDTDFDRYMALRASGTGPRNMYDNPTKFTLSGNATFPSKVIDGNDCVPIWANTLRIPDWDIVSVYTTKLAEIDRTIEIDAMAMRVPFLIIADDNEKQTVMNTLKMLYRGEPAIVATSTFGADIESKIKLLDMRMDRDIVLNLLIAKSKIWNECMTMLGINNSNQDKKERLVSDEVSANDSQVMMTRNVQLTARQRAVEQINRKYNLSVSVEWNSQSDMLEDSADISPGGNATPRIRIGDE